MNGRRSLSAARIAPLLAAVTALHLLSACGGAEPRPSDAEDVRRAFADEGVRLVPSTGAADSGEWATLLVGADDPGLQVQVYSAPEAAATFAGSFEALLGSLAPRISLPGRPPAPRRDPPLIRRRGNVLVLARAESAAGLSERIEHALARLPAA